MRLFKFLTVILLVSTLITACSNFTNENLKKVHVGMSSNEIRTMFGDPINISTGVCGKPPKQWMCTTWGYQDTPDSYASFTFAEIHNSLKLNHFDVRRDPYRPYLY